MAYNFDHLRSVRVGVEGVGSYGSDPTLTSAEVAEIMRDSGGPTFDVGREELDVLSPRRNGQKLITTSKSVSVAYNTFMRAHVVPSSDDSNRPSVHHFLRGGGFLDAYSNGGGGGPYTITYTLADFPEAMDSVFIEDIVGNGANSTAMQRAIAGVRWSLKFSASKGGRIKIEAAGKGKSYTKTDTGSALPNDDLPTGQVFTLQGATLTLTTVDGTPAYSGPLEAFEIDTAMNVVEIGDGTETGLVDEVQLHPTQALMASVTVQDQLVAGFNAEGIRDSNLEQLHFKLQLPSLASAATVLIFDGYYDIDTVEYPLLAGGARGQKINLKSMFFDASTPGVTPAEALRITFQTTP